MRTFAIRLIMLGLFAGLIFPGFGDDIDQTGEENHRFDLSILRNEPIFDKDNWIFDYSQIWEKLKKSSGSDILFSIGVDEIESYDWIRQSLTLTPEASQRLLAALPLEEDLNPHSLEIKKMSESLGWSNVIGLSLNYKGFIVRVDGQPVYGGIFLEPISQLAILFPVLRTSIQDNRAVLFILPVHVTFWTCDPVLAREAGDVDHVAEEASEYWDQFPLSLRDHFKSAAKSEIANEFRKLIMSLSIRNIMKDAGKLAE